MMTLLRRHRSRRAPLRATRAAVTAVTAALALTACAGGEPAIVGRSAGPASQVAAPPQPQEYATVPEPGPPLGDTSSLRGRTVYFIPATSVAPVFTIEGNAAAEAFRAVGLELRVCDGQAAPDVVARCVGQAIAANAAGIIAASNPPEFARQAFGDAVEAGIPTLFVNTADDSVPPEWGAKAAALANNWSTQAELNNDLIVADSGGTADVLYVGVTDSSATRGLFDDGMVGSMKRKCPGCGVTSVATSSSQINQLTSQVSTALVRDPDIDYVFVAFDSFAAPVIEAIRQQNRQGEVKLLSVLSALDGMERVSRGEQFASTGYSLAALGYNEADVLLRMMLGQDPRVDAHRTPIKTFTAANVGEAELTPAGWQSGQWQTGQDFRAMYRQLWGAA